MAKAPVHLWIIGVLSLFWNAGGAADHIMTVTDNAAYLAQQPAARLSLLAEAPGWFSITWAVGVWFSIIGSALLLLRSRFAGSAFALSLLGLIGSSVYTYGIAGGGSMVAAAGVGAIVFSVAIPLILVGLWVYARAMTRRGVLA
ncbi:MAG: hypothetical protein AAGF56_02455 [Pseudomonadota bacterium]